MKVLQINITVNSDSTGRIVEDIGKVLIQHGHESYVAYSRGRVTSASKLIRVGNKFDMYMHALLARLFDIQGFASVRSTKKLISEIDRIKPDVIGLNNLTGYYINVKILFDYLNSRQIPVLWTLFDCWAFTGHCTYFDVIQCEKWQTKCFSCPNLSDYPKSWTDNSKNNFIKKKALFTQNKNMSLLVHSQWLAGLVKKSFLGHIPVHVTPSAVDIDVFKPVETSIQEKHGLKGKMIILGCASVWVERKGLNDFIKLSKIINDDFRIVVIGVNKEQKKLLPENITGIERTENVSQLVEWYNAATVFVNPTYQDNFPTTNIEALACGTPVVTYHTGGSPEAVVELTGRVVEKGNINGLLSCIDEIARLDKNILQQNCRNRAVKLYDKSKQFLEYLNQFQLLANKSNSNN
jgi:putative colanic acid biosynthesis glycosyltransferase